MKTFLESFEIFNGAEIDQLIDCAKYRHQPKDSFFIRNGKICNEVAFIKSGIFRSFYYSVEGNEFTSCINFPNNFITAYSSYITGNESIENIQAVTDAEVFVIQKEDIVRLSHNNLNMVHFLKIMAEQEYLALEKRIFQLQKEKAKQRYLNMLSDYPDYIKHIPLNNLASYLGITQRHLSRLRKENCI